VYGEIFVQVNKLCSVSDDPSEFSQDKDDVTREAGKYARAERIRYLPGVNHVTYGQMPCGGCERSFLRYCTHVVHLTARVTHRLPYQAVVVMRALLCRSQSLQLKAVLQSNRATNGRFIVVSR